MNEIRKLFYHASQPTNNVFRFGPFFFKVYTILDEFILSGEVEESAKTEILERVREMEKLE